MSSLNVRRQLKQTVGEIEKLSEKLSSGYKIKRAAADGALNETVDVLQRMCELAVQAATEQIIHPLNAPITPAGGYYLFSVRSVIIHSGASAQQSNQIRIFTEMRKSKE